MITQEELLWIKKVRQEFHQKFGRKLYIDLFKMNGFRERGRHWQTENTHDAMKVALERRFTEHGASMEKLKYNVRLSAGEMIREREALMDFAHDVSVNRWNKSEAAKLIGKHRTFFSHYKTRYI